MSQILASSKTGLNKYDLKANDPNKVLPRLDVRQLAQSCQSAYEMTQGYSLSGDEGSADAIVTDLSIIDVSNIGAYENDLAQMIQTFVANASRLDVDAGSTANSIILNAPKIAPGNSPNGNDYSKDAALPFQYQEYQRFTFRATITNTGATVVQIPALVGLVGSVDLVDENENNLTGGEIEVNKYYTIVCKTVSAVKKLKQYLQGVFKNGFYITRITIFL